MNLPDIGVLSITGAERQQFCQRLITCNLDALKAPATSPAALCDAKGRISANFTVLLTEPAVHLLLAASMVKLLQKKLHTYALFSKVTLTNTTDQWFFYGIQNDHNTQPKDMCAPVGYWEIHYPNTSRTLIAATTPQHNLHNTIDAKTWRLNNIQDGIAEIQPETSGLFIPQMINLEKFGGVSFNKGCYPGQEIIARTQHLGKLKRHMHHVRFATMPPVENGAPITTTDQRIVGQLLNHAPFDHNCSLGLAVIEDRAVEQVLTVNGKTLVLAP